MSKPRDYALFFFQPNFDKETRDKIAKLHKSDPEGDQHAGERETSTLLYLRPDLVKQDSATLESGVNQKRVDIQNVYTPIWWYADYPNHYAGEGAKATRELGQAITEATIDQLVQALKAIKADTKTLQLQNEFYDRVDNAKKKL